MPDATDRSDGPAKDDGEHPVPLAWRPTLEAIVGCFVQGDWELDGAPTSVERLSVQDAQDIAASVVGYGDVTLAPLPAETWLTSVCSWGKGRWEVLVDLWTVEEGRSDLILHAKVVEAERAYRFGVHFVYVP